MLYARRARVAERLGGPALDRNLHTSLATLVSLRFYHEKGKNRSRGLIQHTTGGARVNRATGGALT